MGLAERRAARNFETGKFPKIKQDIDKAAGFEVPIEIDWNSLGEEGYANSYEDDFPKIYFQPLIYAFKDVCIDDLGRDALKQGLKKVTIRNTAGSATVRFNNGELLLDFPYSNIDYWEERKKEIQQVLEKGL